MVHNSDTQRPGERTGVEGYIDRDRGRLAGNVPHNLGALIEENLPSYRRLLESWRE